MQQAAKKFGKPRLAALSMSMRADVFAKVKANIDSMVVALKKEQADEVKTKDFCIKEFQQNDLQTAEKQNTKEDLTTALNDLATSKGELTEAIDALKAEIAET